MNFPKKFDFSWLDRALQPISKEFFKFFSNVVPLQKKDDSSMEISLAAGTGDLKALKIILSLKNPSFDLPDDKGDTPLFYAARGGHTEVIDFLCGQKIDVNHANIAGKTAVFYAVELNQLDALDSLIKHGAKLDIKNADGITVIHQALLAGQEPALIFLAETPGAPLAEPDRFDHSPLILAADGQLLNACKTLLSKDVPVDWSDQEGWTALMHATKRGHLEMMSVLISAGASIHSHDRDFKQTPYLIACRNGHIEAMELLLRNNANSADIDYYSRTALHIAVETNRLEVVEFVLKTPVDLHLKDRFGLTALEWAVVNSSADILKVIRDAVAKSDKKE
ncbi:MAG: ankyrin repeat domain-containing protein [Gammaproteobacteria bacterium]|nr:ankyrin repeat domain-containing protein [Gammaproteobacteria bacterium]